MQSIFCDESGFTGENLLAPTQRIFAYASVAIDVPEQADLAAKVRRDYRVQSPELKGRGLLAYSKWRRAIDLIVDAIGTRTLIAARRHAWARIDNAELIDTHPRAYYRRVRAMPTGLVPRPSTARVKSSRRTTDCALHQANGAERRLQGCGPSELIG